MKRVVGVLIFVLLVAMPTGAMAVQEGGDGKISAALALNFGLAEGTTSTTIFTQTSLGYFIAAEHEVGLTVVGAATRTESGETSASGGIVAFQAEYRYHIPTGTIFVPYVGPRLGGVFFKAANVTETIPSFGGFAGLDIFLTEKVSLFSELSYQRFTVSDTDFNQVALFFGLSYLFRLGR